MGWRYLDSTFSLFEDHFTDLGSSFSTVDCLLFLIVVDSFVLGMREGEVKTAALNCFLNFLGLISCRL